jgi:hypothetical protein
VASYVLPKDEEEEQQQAQQPAAPKLGGSSMFAGGSSGGAPSQPTQTPKAQNAQMQGTGFTNLQRWLDAGSGRHQGIANTGSNLVNTEKDTFNKAAKPLEDATYGAKLINSDPSNGNQAHGVVGKAIDTGDTSELEGFVSNKYEGPRTVEYDPTKQKNLWDAASLTNKNTAGSVLAKPQVDAGQYSQGMRRLDSVLFGADRASRDAMGGVKTGLETFGKESGEKIKGIGEKIAGFDRSAAEANEKNAADLRGVAGSMMDSINQRVAATQAQDAEVKRMTDAGYVWNPTLKMWKKPETGMMPGQVQGGNANASNIATERERRGLDMLNKVLGGGVNTIAGTTDPYTKASQGAAVKDPNHKEPEAPLSPEYMAKFQEAATNVYNHVKDGAVGFWEGGDATTAQTRLAESLSDMTPEQQKYAIDELQRRTQESVFPHLNQAQRARLREFFDSLRQHGARMKGAK